MDQELLLQCYVVNELHIVQIKIFTFQQLENILASYSNEKENSNGNIKIIIFLVKENYHSIINLIIQISRSNSVHDFDLMVTIKNPPI